MGFKVLFFVEIKSLSSESDSNILDIIHLR